MSEIPPLFAQQQETVDFMADHPLVFDMSDPGTGKTRGHLQAFWNRRILGGGGAIVFAPKSILQPAWGNDIDMFFPGMRYSVAYATNRLAAFEAMADIYITNHDAVKWLMGKKCPLKLAKFLSNIDTLIIDESTAYKHHSSQRSKAIRKLSGLPNFKYIELMTGTPNPNSVTELWHQTYLLDKGERLGKRYWAFRNSVQEPVQIGPQPQMVKWTDKANAEDDVFDSLRDITIRHPLTGVPGNHETNMMIDLPKKLRKAYDDMLAYAMTMTEKGEVLTAVHAASLNTKLLQICAGTVYDGNKKIVTIDDGRVELIMDLVEARDWPCVIPFLYRHQRIALMEAASKRGLEMEFIDGEVTSDAKRLATVEKFQRGELNGVIVHPQSAGHGLTLTKGRSTIFMSPTYNAEHYKQVFHRIVRKGQEFETETINILAKNTLEEVVNDKLGSKLNSMQLLLELVQNNKEVTI